MRDLVYFDEKFRLDNLMYQFIKKNSVDDELIPNNFVIELYYTEPEITIKTKINRIYIDFDDIIIELQLNDNINSQYYLFNEFNNNDMKKIMHYIGCEY